MLVAAFLPHPPALVPGLTGGPVAELEPLVRQAERAAREAGPAEDAQPLVEGVPAASDFTDEPAETSPEVFAAFGPALGEAMARARAEGRDGCNSVRISARIFLEPCRAPR